MITIKGHKLKTYQGSNFIIKATCVAMCKNIRWLEKLSNGILCILHIYARLHLDTLVRCHLYIIIGKGINTIIQASNNEKL